MHTYAFGSICRGDMSLGSDIDLLVIVESHDSRIDPNTFSMYSYKRIQEIWQEGNPFAWHLSSESRLLFSSDKLDYLKLLGSPEIYKTCVKDCEKFFSLFCEAHASIIGGGNSRIFDLSTVFLSIRNIATCFSLGTMEQPVFSRNSALSLEANTIPIILSNYHILERARLLCTRGYGENLTSDEISNAISSMDEIYKWMDSLLTKAMNHERV